MYLSDQLNANLPYAFGDELEWLRTMGRTLHYGLPKTIVMIGCGPGVMATALFEGLQTSAVYFHIIDIQFDGTAEAHLKQIGFDGCVVYTKGRSQEVQLEIPSIDLLIVDGDHSYEGVKGDIEHWWTKVANGGHVFFHDVIDLEKNGTNGVQRAINDSFSEGKMPGAVLVAQPGISCVYQVLHE